MPEPSKPWDQQEGEPDSSYAGFLIYKSLPPATRSIHRAYSLVYGPAPNGNQRTASGHWRQMCSLWNWKERADKWDIYLLEKTSKKAEKKQIDHAEKINRIVDNFLTHADAIMECNSVEQLVDKKGSMAVCQHTVGKKGSIIGHVLNTHKTFFGQKHEIKGSGLKVTFHDFSREN